MTTTHRLFTPLLTTLLATSLVGACATSPADDPMDPEDPMDPMDPVTPMDPPAGCTPATDVVPLDELADSLAHFTGYAGDIARASDGTIYFVSEVAGDLQSATIGRREPCKAIETDWLTVSAPIIDLEIGADDKLYLAASGAGAVADLEARLYRVDPASPSAIPDVLIRQPGEKLYSLSAGPTGRVFFIQGYSQRNVRYVDGDDIKTVMVLPYSTSYAMSVAALSDGNAIVSGTTISGAQVSRQVARLDLPASGGGILQLPTVVSKSLHSLRADASGGFYGVYETGGGSLPLTCALVHGATPSTPPTLVAENAAAVESCRVAFGIDEDPRTAIVFTPAAATRATVVTLPTPVMTF